MYTNPDEESEAAWTRLIVAFVEGRTEEIEAARVKTVDKGRIRLLSCDFWLWPFAATLASVPGVIFVPSGTNAITGAKELRDEIWCVAEIHGLKPVMNNELLEQLYEREQLGLMWQREQYTKWHPGHVRLLVICATPQASSSKHGRPSFYAEPFTRQDDLYRAVMRAVLGRSPGRPGDAKKDNLEAIASCGVFVVEMPVEVDEDGHDGEESSETWASCIEQIGRAWPEHVVIIGSDDIFSLLPPEVTAGFPFAEPLPFPRGPGLYVVIGGVRRALGGAHIEEGHQPQAFDQLHLYEADGIWPRFVDALAFASRIYRGWRVPYLGHALGVASIVIAAGGNEDLAVAALMHRAFTDLGGPHGPDGSELDLSIEGRFGSRVAWLVRACALPDEPGQQSWRERREGYLEDMEEARTDVLLLVLADHLQTVRQMSLDYEHVGKGLWTKLNTTRDDQLWYSVALADLFKRRSPGPLAEELSDLIDRIARRTGEI
jgi:hypothetical protein